ncbi:kanosamine-6-phosphate phosphatase [Geomicrobium halophilum]|uniref:Kanosamine-6-phosphate phosphatase n=1 Tax=Geomicrobium halophilum TaxID=549000 RepID=A0A841PRC8_9BACL|nr:HAD-IIB family hydrolase [Geomicrobium halophilum]MBB6449726.1 kanosamine-6-phosphate phosphatase [Geomicrobium halophilum]
MNWHNPKKTTLRQYDDVNSIKYIVYSDLDETLYSHKITDEEKTSIQAFENYMEHIVKNHQVLFGVITGSSLDSVIQKLETGIHQIMPHFVACDLGTMLYWVKNDGNFYPDQEWVYRLKNMNFNQENVNAIVKDLEALHKIEITPQTQLGSSSFKKNYYYYMIDDLTDKHNIEMIRDFAYKQEMDCNINICNPLAGDPERAYDIDFIPKNTGKAAIVEFINQKFKVGMEYTFAFGDSGNDLEMLSKVGHGYLLDNATTDAKKQYEKVTSNPYTKGILNILKENFGH